jgi:adenylate cyclase
VIAPGDILAARVLIVDDRRANVLLLEEMLRGAGYTSVTSTMDPEKVCELHLLNRYDLILLDLQMPGMDGFEVMENLKQVETGGYLPVLVVTAQAAHKLRALKAGARDFVSKPFDLPEVLLRVHNLIEVRLLHQETRQLCERVVAEQSVSRRLLHDALPADLAERLVQRPEGAGGGPEGLVAGSSAEVAVLFADLLEFSAFSEGAAAQVLVGVLDELSTRLEALPHAARRERSRIVGDAYLAAVGLAGPLAEHSLRAADKALDLVEALDRFNQHSRYQLRLRIGLEAGGPRSFDLQRGGVAFASPIIP